MNVKSFAWLLNQKLRGAIKISVFCYVQAGQQMQEKTLGAADAIKSALTKN